MLRFISRLGLCSFGEQDFGSAAHESEKEKGSVSTHCPPQPGALYWYRWAIYLGKERVFILHPMT